MTGTHLDDKLLSLLFPKIILICVSLAKWLSVDRIIWCVTLDDRLFAAPISAKCVNGCCPGELISLLGECGGDAYNGDRQSNKSASFGGIFETAKKKELLISQKRILLEDNLRI